MKNQNQYQQIIWWTILATLLFTVLGLAMSFTLNASMPLEIIFNGIFQIYTIALGDAGGEWGAVSLSILGLYFGIDLLALLLVKSGIVNQESESPAKPMWLNVATHVKALSGTIIVGSSWFSLILLLGSDSASSLYHYNFVILPVAVIAITWAYLMSKHYNCLEHNHDGKYLPLAIAIMVIFSDIPQFVLTICGVQATGNLGILFANFGAYLCAIGTYQRLRPFWNRATDWLSQLRLLKRTIEDRANLQGELTFATKTAMLQFLIVSRLLINLLTAAFLAPHTVLQLPEATLYCGIGVLLVFWLLVVREFVCCSIALSKANGLERAFAPFEPFLIYGLLCQKARQVYGAAFLRYQTAMLKALGKPGYKQLETHLPESDRVFQKAKSIANRVKPVGGTDGWLSHSVVVGFSLLGFINPAVGLDPVWIEALEKQSVMPPEELGVLKQASVMSYTSALKTGVTSVAGIASLGGLVGATALGAVVYDAEIHLKPEVDSSAVGIATQSKEFHDLAQKDPVLREQVNGIGYNRFCVKTSTKVESILPLKGWDKTAFGLHSDTASRLLKINQVCKEKYNFSLSPMQTGDARARPSTALFNAAIEYAQGYITHNTQVSSTPTSTGKT